MPVSPARAAAFEILMRIETTDAYGSEMLHSSRFAKLSPADHGLLTEVVMGVLRWRGLLDRTIAEHLRSPADGVASRKSPALVAKDATRTGHPPGLSNQSLAKLDLEVLTALRMGAYQILFLDRVPKHAAVNESVELVKSAHKRSAAGLVNAVLRKIERAPSDSSDDSSHPGWLVERWARIYGADRARKISAYDQTAPVQAIRMAPAEAIELRSSGRAGLPVPTRVVDELAAEGVLLEPAKLLSTAFTVTSGDITATKAFRERRVMIQDEGSQLVAMLVGHGKNILDCCAAPGGKTRIIAERNPEATVLAMDLHPQRAALLLRLGTAENVRVVTGDVRKMPVGGDFDRVLVDAPCSGTGTLARNPEIKWRLKAEDLLRLQEYQVEVLRAAMKHLAPGGQMVYSTCSLEPEENEDVIQKALAGDSSFRVVNCGDELDVLRASGDLIWAETEPLVSGPYLRTIPGEHPCDGFFAAMIVRE
jgi:16S rRNA (cytosine967-C5)-methyltransferase